MKDILVGFDNSYRQIQHPLNFMNGLPNTIKFAIGIEQNDFLDLQSHIHKRRSNQWYIRFL